MFKKLYADQLHKIKNKVDIFYAKSFDHISDWKSVFKSISKISNKGTCIYIKHHSFFSYLGPHRYSSTFIPWGHLLLNDSDYKKYVDMYHPERKEKMENFFFKELTYPRITINELFKIAKEYDFIPHLIVNEPMKNSQKIAKFISDIPNFWNIIKSNYPDYSSDEVLSGRIHIILIKI